jgi:intracellular septation protein A
MIIKTPGQARRLITIVVSLTLLAAGIVLWAWPAELHRVLCITGGVSLVVMGIFFLVRPREAQRVFVVVAGAVLLLVGAVMMVTPGPGIPAIIGGLALLATEFVWARRLLQRVKDEAVKVKNAVFNGKKKNEG